MAGKLTGCDTGPAPTPDASNSPRTQICSDTNWKYCCTSGKVWDLACVEQADAMYPSTATDCGRDAWTAIQIPNTQQYFPRDFNVVALDGYIMGIVDVDDPIAASAWVTAKYFSLNRLQREPWAVISNTVSLCSGTVSGNVSHPSATNTYNDTCAMGKVTYNPTSFGPQGNLTTSFFDFSAAKAKMWAMSVALRDYENQITAAKSNTTDTTLTFTAKYSDINVFNVDAKWLSGTTSFVFNLPNATASVIVNIIPDKASASGTTALLMSISNASISSSIGGQSGKMAPGNLLWNIPTTLGSTDILSNLTISSTGFVGTLLAPNTVLNLYSTNVTGTIVAQSVQMASSEPHSAPYHVPASQLALAKQYIKHIVVIMQENRSFDNYFGTFPNATGIPSTVMGKTYDCDGSCNCSLNATGAGKYKFAPNPSPEDKTDLPHGNSDFQKSIANPVDNGATLSPADFLHAACQYIGGNSNTTALQDVLGYHVGNSSSDELYNYWQYAKNFVLQENMFESMPDWSPMEHNYMVSGWNADCSSGACQTSLTYNSSGTYLWNDISNLLCGAGVSWMFYKGEDWIHDCTSCASPKDIPTKCFNAEGSDSIVGFWSPLTRFQAYLQNKSNPKSTGDIAKLQSFYNSLNNVGTSLDPDGSQFPAVSWIVPGKQVAEHTEVPGTIDTMNIKWGEAYVTSIINALMSNRTLWETTAIFLSWDDWGGFYDHIPPVKNGTADAKNYQTYGLRVPGLVISPWVKSAGYIDPNQLSHDAYLKFIEDVFLGGKRIRPGQGNGCYTVSASTDPRTEAREALNASGDLRSDFDFSHSPLPPLTGLQCEY